MSHQPQQHRGPGPNAIAGFLDRYGWRAYALPVLTLLTLIALFRAGGGHDPAAAVDHQTATRPAVGPAATPTAGPASPTSARPSARAVRPTRAQKVTIAPDPTSTGAPVDGKSAQAGAATRCRGNSSARKVVVSIAAQHAWMCRQSSLVYSSAVTTGETESGHATPTGTFEVQGDVTDTTLTGSDYAVHVAFWIPFNGDIGFHDASWQTMKFGAQDYPTQGSRGCVHMPLASVAWLHKWVRVGRTVVVVSKS